MIPPKPEATETEVLIYLARLEGKLDTAIGQHGERISAAERVDADHERRLRDLEAKDTVSPRQLWATFASGVLVVAAVAPFLTKVFIVTS